jgi:cell wall-associated NlpC family hydrolase
VSVNDVFARVASLQADLNALRGAPPAAAGTMPSAPATALPGTQPTSFATALSRATAASAPGPQAVSFAMGRLGTPYVWGGESPSGYDCSGLVQASYRAAGVSLPRVAQGQYDAGPHLAPGEPLQPGDLVFFGSDSSHVDHVGIVVGNGQMIDAPHTGAVVRVESYTRDDLVGATRPGAASSVGL